MAVGCEDVNALFALFAHTIKLTFTFRVYFQGSVEFIKSDVFEIHINTTAPSVDELSRVHYNYTAIEGSALLQIVSIC